MSIELDKEERSLKTIMDLLISEEPGSDTHFLNIEAFDKIDSLSQSLCFKALWRETAEQAKKTEFTDLTLIPLDQVHDKIYKPALEEFKNLYKLLRDLSMSLQELESKLGKFLNSMSKELEIMADVFTEGKHYWTQRTDEHIKRYGALQSVKVNAEVIIELKNNLHLRGGFGGIDNLEVRTNFCFYFYFQITDTTRTTNFAFDNKYSFHVVVISNCSKWTAKACVISQKTCPELEIN